MKTYSRPFVAALVVLSLLVTLACQVIRPAAEPSAAPSPPLPTWTPTAAPPPVTGVVVKIVPAADGVKTGATVAVAVRIEQVMRLYGAEVHLTFDPELLEVVDTDPGTEGVEVAHGTLLHPDFVALNRADNDAGTVDYAIAQMPPHEAVSGSGDLVIITFRGKTTAESAMIVIDSALLASPEGAEIPATVENAGITVSGAAAPPEPTPGAVVIPEDIRAPGIAAYYEAVPVRLPERFQGAAYTLPVDWGTLKNADQFTLSSAQRAMLRRNGFVVSPADWPEFYQVYEATRYDDAPIFVTTDSVYHVYHLIFDKLLRDLERESLAPAIEALTSALVDAAQQQYADARGTPLEDAARRVWGYFVVAQQLIAETPPPIPAAVADEVNRELALIDAHGGIAMSPLLTLPEAFKQSLFCDPNATPDEAEKFYCEDYSQYVPRGHYTRDAQLQRYFRAMMWYGRINLRLQYPRETRMALLITRLIRGTQVNGQPAADVWASVYDPTAFLVGKADDLSFHEYGPLMDAVFGPAPDVSMLADDVRLDAFIDAARQLPPPQINSMWVYIWEDEDEVTQGFRFMGQRFVLDAYIFEQLIEREVSGRLLPKGLDVFAAMGSDEAYAILDEMGETDAPGYEEQLAKVKGEIAALGVDSWTQNLYWNWLYALQAVVAPKDAAYPPFMQTPAWTRKDLHTALGSWTELKHDTILYAKQVMAELGGGDEAELTHGYVEPSPEAYARLRALAQMTSTGLDARGILKDQGRYLLGELANKLTFLQDVAERELSGEEISADAYEEIKFFGGWLEWMTVAAADAPEEGFGNELSEDEQAALVADVATDPNGFVLEEAIGRIYEIHVVAPDGAGGLQIAKGGVFSYYEFRWPLDDRLTDEKWRAMVTEGSQPNQPDWTASFIAK